jgi:prolycopene isomerase
MGPEEIARHTFCVSIFGDPADPRDEPLSVYLSSRADPSAAPEGHASLTLHEFAAYEDWARLADLPDGGRGPAALERPEAYRRAKEETAARALARAEGVFPGLAGRMVVRDAATPVTYERYTGNRAGASVGWNWNPAHRPISGIKGPVAGLVTVGHWSYSPGGIPTALITGYLLGKSV